MTTQAQQQEPSIRVRGMNVGTNSIITRQAAKIEVLEIQLENAEITAQQAQEAITRLTEESEATIKRLEDQLLEAKTPPPHEENIVSIDPVKQGGSGSRLRKPIEA